MAQEAAQLAQLAQLARANSQQLELFDPTTGVPLNAEAEAFCVACWTSPLVGEFGVLGE
jgi:hypothetical protein